MKDILLITPPFTQLNTPYPATAYLKGFLNTKNKTAYQMDLGMEVILQLFTKEKLQLVFNTALENDTIISANAQRIYTLRDSYLKYIADIILFLQGKNQTFARLICTDNFLPRASRFDQLDDLDWAFGSMGLQDKAKHLCTLLLEDLSDFIIECIDGNFGFSRYAESLGRSANDFNELYDELQQEITFIDAITLDLLDDTLEKIKPKMVCFSVPFPGNLYSSFRCAQYIKTHFPSIKTAMGGGFPNTELRQVTDTRVFSFFDFITLDDGELPIELLLKNSITTDNSKKEYKRTLLLENGKIVYKNCNQTDYKQNELGTPDYSDLLLDQYLSVIEIANPMHSLWSDGRWNKLTMAHGCYWSKCTFCDISLDYIKLYEPITANILVDRMEEIIAQTGETGFHFVDEAAPPALMKSLAIEILKRKLTVTWWTNIRFEKNFTKDLCLLLQASGCIAVSGGLEVASDRLLRLIDKGVTVEQVAKVTRNFTEANIMVHSYLMYGYPTQTIQETVDSLEMVRQMFKIGILQSGFWHQFALTAHSPVGINPKDYAITPHYNDITFANNDIEFTDHTGIDHSQFSYGLKKSLFNFMHGVNFELPLQDWFDFKIPKTTIHTDYIYNSLENELPKVPKPQQKVYWLGTIPNLNYSTKTKRGVTRELVVLQFHEHRESYSISLEKEHGEWLANQFSKLKISENKPLSFANLKTSFEANYDNFELFWSSKAIQQLRNRGLLLF
ncbi:radical SAM protein [uncultured Maribacter sp.]|uniref:B12-binding domain-containing radical SAM protein n=1 Tax=uncultured Maribacter sp. TaxID=431308 RepID=UPI00260FF2BD|nr:radical SAM protein [uncultured Maribacter sp.]